MLGWFDPTSFILPLLLVNSTYFMWINGTSAGTSTVYYYQAGLTYAPASTYEDSSVYMYIQQLCRYAAVKPLNLTYARGTTYVYAANIYCSPDGIHWAWLKWLPLRLTAFKGNVTFVSVNATAYTAIGNFTGRVPEGWYSTGNDVFRLPGRSVELNETAMLRAEIAALTAELNNTRAELAAERAKANASAQAAAAYKAEAERLRQEYNRTAYLLSVCRNQVAQLSSSLGAVQEQLNSALEREASLRKEVAALSNALAGNRSALANLRSQVADLQNRLAEAESEKWLFLGLGLTVAGVVSAVNVLARRREAI
ncbi:MAG: hypothetical protein ACP5I3_12135 [Thermoproteus sp.]